MSSAYGSSVASAMGIHPDPIGTLDELRRESIDPAMVGSCSPPSPGVSGCKHYEQCVFRFKKNGGFRDQGPAGIGYYHRTHEGRQHENDVPCHFFMKKMYHRMRDGERDRQDGKGGEIVEIIAIEPGRNHPLSGLVIHRQMTINENDGTALVAKWVKKTITSAVARFPRPADRQTIAYDTLVDDRRRLREAQDPAVEMPAHRVSVEAIEEDPVIDLEPLLAETPSGPAPSAVPVERKSKA